MTVVAIPKRSIDVATTLCKAFEQFYAKPYLCPSRVPTIGYGATYYENGRRVTLADPAITEERASELLAFHLTCVYLPEALRLSPVLARYPEALGAIGSFCMNLGSTKYSSSTLRRCINAEDWAGAREQIVLWRNSNGKRLRGLELRRAAEAAYLPN